MRKRWAGIKALRSVFRREDNPHFVRAFYFTTVFDEDAPTVPMLVIGCEDGVIVRVRGETELSRLRGTIDMLSRMKGKNS